jgi:hypothetical protein
MHIPKSTPSHPLNANDRFLHRAFTKLFRAAGFDDFDYDFTKQNYWFLKRTWTPEAESDFGAWFVSEAQHDLKYTKDRAEKELGWFLLSFGWKATSEEK